MIDSPRHLVPLSLVALAIVLSAVFFLAPSDSTNALDAGGAGGADVADSLLYLLLMFAPAFITWIAALLAFRERGQRAGVRRCAFAALGFTAAALIFGLV